MKELLECSRSSFVSQDRITEVVALAEATFAKHRGAPPGMTTLDGKSPLAEAAPRRHQLFRRRASPEFAGPWSRLHHMSSKKLPSRQNHSHCTRRHRPGVLPGRYPQCARVFVPLRFGATFASQDYAHLPSWGIVPRLFLRNNAHPWLPSPQHPHIWGFYPANSGRTSQAPGYFGWPASTTSPFFTSLSTVRLTSSGGQPKSLVTSRICAAPTEAKYNPTSFCRASASQIFRACSGS